MILKLAFPKAIGAKTKEILFFILAVEVFLRTSWLVGEEVRTSRCLIFYNLMIPSAL